MGKAKRKSSQDAPESIAPLLAPLQALQNLLLQFNEQGVIIGGIAVSLLEHLAIRLIWMQFSYSVWMTFPDYWRKQQS